jgi:SAM-dependent methyltransferase
MRHLGIKNFIARIKKIPFLPQKSGEIADKTPDVSSQEIFAADLMDAHLSGWFRQETDELIEGFGISSEDVVLDVGCGDSPFLHFCAMRGPEILYADIDVEKVKSMSRILEDTSAKSRIPLVCDACHLPLAEGTATKIIAMEVMEHVDDVNLLLKELVRVGKSGAQYLISVPDPVAERLQKKLAPPSYFEKPNHIRIIEREEFERRVVAAGLKIEQRKSYGFYWAIWWLFFWTCNQDLHPPWHPLLENWTKTWGLLLETKDGLKVKRALDEFMPKSQAIIARKMAA